MLIVFAVVFILSALLLYSAAIWGEKLLRQGLLPWMVWFLVAGMMCDLAGTSLMTAQARATGTPFTTVHGIAGLAALIIMALHVVWALLAAYRFRGQCQELFSRFSVVAWAVWMVAFVLGIPRAH